MCGIFASYNRFPDIETIKTMMFNRGPDEFHYKDEGAVRLCHSRLSITGEKGAQPFEVKQRGQHFLYMVNGEFYDYQSIKKSFNYHYQTDTDSEILSPLYLKTGLTPDLMSHLNGEFAFVIYNVKEHAFYLVRDRFGVKPLFYTINEGEVLIASETKMLLPFIESDFNYDVLKTMLTVQYHNHQSVLFENIHQVPPGSIVKIDLNTCKVTTSYYFDYKSDLSCSKVSGQKLLDVFENSVKKRTDTDLPIAYTVSGGIDSSAILSMGHKPKGSRAFTVSFEGSGEFDEIELAQKMADYAGVDLNPLLVNESSLLDNMEKAITASESLSINSHVAAKYMMFEEIKKQGFKISLSGEGADEVFLGYSHFLMDANLEITGFENMQGMHLPHGDILSEEFLASVFPKVPSFLKAKLSMGAKMHPLLSKDFRQDYQSAVVSQLKPMVTQSKTDVINAASLWTKTCFANYILNALSDRLEMRHSLEGRVPFLDKDLVALGLSMPESQKINASGTKHMLRESFKTILPSEIYKKPKHPFVSPSLMMWSENPVVFSYFSDIMNSQSFKEMGIFNRQSVMSLLDNLQSGKVEKQGYDNVLMLMLSVFFLYKNLVKGAING